MQEMYLERISGFVDEYIYNFALDESEANSLKIMEAEDAEDYWKKNFLDGVSWEEIFAIMEAVTAVVARNSDHLYLVDYLVDYFNVKRVASSEQTINQWIEANGGWIEEKAIQACDDQGVNKQIDPNLKSREQENLSQGDPNIEYFNQDNADHENSNLEYFKQEYPNQESSDPSQSQAVDWQWFLDSSPAAIVSPRKRSSDATEKEGRDLSEEVSQSKKVRTKHTEHGSSRKGKGMATVLSPHFSASQPAKAYKEMLSSGTRIKKVRKINRNVKPTENKLRIVCISDTHNKTDRLVIPYGDILIHAGDFTMKGECEEIIKFADFLRSQPHKHKIVIAGNHELSFAYFDGKMSLSDYQSKAGILVAKRTISELERLNVKHPKELLPDDVIFLSDNMATVYDFNIYGSPWTPYHIGWAYNAKRGEDIVQKWNQIPAESDIVITHGPPVGVGDLTARNIRAGCVDLLSAITLRVRPQLHVFGHIHEGYGQYTIDGSTQFINASVCTHQHKPTNSPICIDIARKSS